jgi:hypothetical protein
VKHEDRSTDMERAGFRHYPGSGEMKKDWKVILLFEKRIEFLSMLKRPHELKIR